MIRKETSGAMTQRLLNIKDLSQFIGISTSTLYTWVSQKRIPHVKCGHLVRFDIKNIENWIAKNSIQEVDFESEFQGN